MKRSIEKKIISIACMVLFLVSLVPVLSGHTDIHQTSDIYTGQFVVEFNSQDLSFSTLNGYDLVTLNGCDFLNDVGKPQVPFKDIRIAVPSGIRLENVNVESVQTVSIPGQYTLYPAQPALPTNRVDTDTTLQWDSTSYSSTQPYPSKTIEFVGETDLAGQPIGEYVLYPLHYIASENSLALTTSITFTVTGVSGYVCGDYLPRTISDQGRATQESMIEDMVLNPEDIHMQSSATPATLALPSGGPYSHVIITTNALSSYCAPLVEWNTKRGLKDTVVTTEYIYANYAGTTNQQKIRNFVIDAYNSWGTLYFFIVGETTSVPIEYRTLYQESTPSDQYYSDFDDDWTHEVFVGRVTANSATEVDLFLDKLLFYEKTPTMTDYLLKMGLFGFDLDASTHGEQLMETISGYTPARFTKTKVYDSYGGSHLSAVTTALNSGQHLVGHADHGDFDWWGIGYTDHGTGMYSAAIDALTNNNKMSIVTTLACDVNGFDSLDAGFSEHWVIYTGNPMQAGLAFNGNTRLGWGYVGNPQGLSGQLVRDWFRGLLQQDKYVLGETIIWSKHQFPTTYPDAGLKQHCEWEFGLLGEPSMPIWTDTPLSFIVTHPAYLPTGSSSFTVHVTSGGAPVSTAYVCLWKGTEVYLTGNTNANGDVTFTPSPTTTGTMYVTTTKHNYLPYESSAEVQQTSNVLVDGHCFYADMNPVNTLTVDLINLNTGEIWQADTNNNYYSKLLLPNDDLHVGDTLRIIAKDTNESVNITDHIVTSGDIGSGAIHTDLILRVHYRDLNKFPYIISTVDTGAAVMKMMMDYLMWNSTVNPQGPPSYYSEQTMYNNYSGGNYINGSEITNGLNHEVDDYHHGWIYGYFFSPYGDTNANEVLKTICIWLDYPLNYYNYARDVPVPKQGHPNHVPIAVPTGGNYNNWMVVRGIHTDRNTWLPPTQLTVYGFWLNDPKLGGVGGNTYVTTSRFLSTYFLPLNVPGDAYNGQYLAITDPYANYDANQLQNTKITLGESTAKVSLRERALICIGANEKGPLLLKTQAKSIIVKCAFDQTMNVLKYDDRGLAEIFSDAVVIGKPLMQNGLWTVRFGSGTTFFDVVLNKNCALEQFSIQ